jgi:xeroderma pigmentosum group C-complementing protein
LGFEGHGGNRTPTIRGIVVHEHNDELLREAHVEMESQLVEDEYKERQRLIYGKWKRLIKGVLTKERLAREYVND